MTDERTCQERWPEATPGAYDPRCCRFPKSCSVEPQGDPMTVNLVPDDEPAEGIPFKRAEDFTMHPDLLAALIEHSPRLKVDRNTLIPFPQSPTGWIYLTYEETP